MGLITQGGLRSTDAGAQLFTDNLVVGEAPGLQAPKYIVHEDQGKLLASARSDGFCGRSANPVQQVLPKPLGIVSQCQLTERPQGIDVLLLVPEFRTVGHGSQIGRSGVCCYPVEEDQLATRLEHAHQFYQSARLVLEMAENIDAQSQLDGSRKNRAKIFSRLFHELEVGQISL